MTKIIVYTALCLFALSAQARSPVGNDNYIPVTEKGMKQGQENIRKQNATTNDRRSDAKFGIQKLQENAAVETSKSTPQQKADLYNLGADLLPFVAPYINEIAKECIDKVDLQAQNAEALVGNCAKKAVSQFQNNPAAFVDRLPASEKQQVEKLINSRLKQSIRPPANRPGYMQP